MFIVGVLYYLEFILFTASVFYCLLFLLFISSVLYYLEFLLFIVSVLYCLEFVLFNVGVGKLFISKAHFVGVMQNYEHLCRSKSMSTFGI